MINALTFTSNGEDEHLTWSQEDALVFDAVFAKKRVTPELPSFDGLSDGEKDTLNKNVERYKQSRVFVVELDATKKGTLINFKTLRFYIAGRYVEASDVGVRYKPVSAYGTDYGYITILASSDGSVSFVDLADAYKKETAPTINAGDRGQGTKQKLKAVGLLALRFDGDNVHADIENAPFVGDYPGNGSAYDFGFDQSYKHKGKNDEYSVGLTRLIHGNKIGDIQVGTATEEEKDAYTYGMWSRKPRTVPEHNYMEPFGFDIRLQYDDITAKSWAMINSGYAIVKTNDNLPKPPRFSRSASDNPDADYEKVAWPYTLYRYNRKPVRLTKRDLHNGIELPVKRYTGQELDHLVPSDGHNTLATDGQYVFGIVNNRGSATKTTEDVLYTPQGEIFKLSDLNINVSNLRYADSNVVDAMSDVLEIPTGFNMDGYILADVSVTSTRERMWLKNKEPFATAPVVPYSRTIAIGLSQINISTQLAWVKHVKMGENTNEEYDSYYVLSLRTIGTRPFRYAGQTYKYYDRNYNIDYRRLGADFLDNVPDVFIKRIFYPYAWSDYIDYSYANKPTMDALDRAIEADIGDAKQQHSIVIATSTGGRLQPRLTTGGI